jgi:AcrR family transcriptional regulator
LLSTGSITEAAKAVRVSKTTFYKWLHNADFQDRYQAARTQAVDQAAAQLQGGCVEAVQVLRALVRSEDTPPAVRATSARIILDFAIGSREIDELGRGQQELRQEIAVLKESR